MQKLLFLLLVLSSAAVAEEAAKTPVFSDVPPGHWAEAALSRLKDAGIVQGKPVSPRRVAAPTAVPRLVPQIRVSNERDAAVICVRVKTSLVFTPALKGTTIDVDVDGRARTIVLTGSAQNDAQKQAATKIAQENALEFKIFNEVKIIAPKVKVPKAFHAR